MNDPQDELEEAFFEGIFYIWRCPHCDEATESDIDVRGDSVNCTACGEDSYLPDGIG